MADNFEANAGSGGQTFASDDIAGVQYPRSKLVHGANGTNDGDVAKTNPLPVGTNTVKDGTGTNQAFLADSDGHLQVDIVGALPAGSAAIGKLAANSGVDIGDVDVTSVPADPFGANADAASATGSISAKLRFIASTGIPVTGNVSVVQGDQAELKASIVGLGSHDDAVITNPVTMGARASAAAPAAVSADEDSVMLWALRSGALCVNVTAAGALIPGDATNGLDVDVTRVQGTVAVTQSGTWNVGTVTTVTTVSTLTGGGVAHDSADSGNPHKIGMKATGAMTGRTLVAADDRTDLFAGLDGVAIVRPHAPLEDLLSDRATNTDGNSTAMAGGFAAPGANIRLYLTTLIIANSSATAVTVDIRDGAAGSVLLTVPVPADTGGVVVNLPVPLKFSANTALAYDASSAVSTLTISVIGFKSKAG